MPAGLPEAEFRRLCRFVYDAAGIHLPPAKRGLVESRLAGRVEQLGFRSFREYCGYVTGPGGGGEIPALLDRITTNKTDFFREPKHFDFLIQTAIPEMRSAHLSGSRDPFRIWSAGCSTGEEPYTAAMVLSEFAQRSLPSKFFFHIVATDLSTRVLEKAQQAVYSAEQAEPVALALRKKYLLRAKDRTVDQVRIVPELREAVEFRRLNFSSADFQMTAPFEVIFCRNVMIYFDRPAQERLVRRFRPLLRPGGYLLIGHSESLNGLDTGLEAVAPSIYRRPE